MSIYLYIHILNKLVHFNFNRKICENVKKQSCHRALIQNGIIKHLA